jgi:para-nitrobenzyl esterase
MAPARRTPPRFPFVFDTVSARFGKELSPQDKEIARAVNHYWVNFCTTGNPNGAGFPM